MKLRHKLQPLTLIQVKHNDGREDAIQITEQTRGSIVFENQGNRFVEAWHAYTMHKQDELDILNTLRHWGDEIITIHV